MKKIIKKIKDFIDEYGNIYNLIRFICLISIALTIFIIPIISLLMNISIKLILIQDIIVITSIVIIILIKDK